jgi:hypothetical protein
MKRPHHTLAILSSLCLLAVTLCDAAAKQLAGKLIYCRNGSLYGVPITATGNPVPGARPFRITRLPAKCELDSLTVSADGSLIVFEIRSEPDGSGDQQVALWGVDARPGAQPHRLGPGSEPRFAPFGKLLAYTGVDINGEDRWHDSVCIRDLQTGKIRVLRPQSHTPRWSSDGKEIALIDESKNDFTATVMVVDAATGKRVLYKNDVINVHTPLLSPNGRYIAYNPHMSRPKLPGAIADRKTGDEAVLPYAGEPVLDWSPDSRWLLWSRDIIAPHNDGAVMWSEIWSTTADGKHSHRFGTGSSGCFAPDGKHILYVRTTAEEDAKPLGLYVSDLRNHRHRLLENCDDVFVVWKGDARNTR